VIYNGYRIEAYTKASPEQRGSRRGKVHRGRGRHITRIWDEADTGDDPVRRCPSGACGQGGEAARCQPLGLDRLYLRLDPSEKLEAVEAVLPPTLRRGQFKAPDTLIASLFAPVATEQVTETRPHETSPAPRDYA
jgi:hypothetical protein